VSKRKIKMSEIFEIAQRTRIHHKKSLRLASRCKNLPSSLSITSQPAGRKSDKPLQPYLQDVVIFLRRFVIEDNNITAHIEFIRSLRSDMQSFVDYNICVLRLCEENGVGTRLTLPSQYAEDSQDIEEDFVVLKQILTEMSVRVPQEMSLLLNDSSDDFHLQVFASPRLFYPFIFV
jgi:hypothetical protein